MPISVKSPDLIWLFPKFFVYSLYRRLFIIASSHSRMLSFTPKLINTYAERDKEYFSAYRLYRNIG
jgi:hypothetical protein